MSNPTIEPKDIIIGKVSEYLHWLTIPKQEFGNLPPCPFLDKELRDDKLYIDIWYPHECSFMDVMESFLLSNKNSALVICPNTHTIDYSEVSRKTIQSQITDLLRKNPQTDYLTFSFFLSCSEKLSKYLVFCKSLCDLPSCLVGATLIKK